MGDIVLQQTLNGAGTRSRLSNKAVISQWNASCPFHKRHCKCSARRQLQHRVLRQNPDSAQALLRSRFIHSMQAADTISKPDAEQWRILAIPLIDSDSGLDQAVHAFIKVYGRSNSNNMAGFAHYARSLQSLRTTCESGNVSEANLLTAGLCILYDLKISAHSPAIGAHGEGIAAMLTSKHPRQWKGDTASALFYTTAPLIFNNAVFTGSEASPFDRDDWVGVTPRLVHLNCASTLRVRHLSQILLVRLPRLIAMIRRCAAHEERCSIDHSKVAHLIWELLAVRDEGAESECFNRVRWVETQNSALHTYYKRSYAFDDLNQYLALTLWWTGRLMLVNLAIKYFTSISNDLAEPASRLRSLEETRSELCDHLWMVLDYTVSLSAVSHWAYVQATPPLYGALGNLGAGLERNDQLRAALVACYSLLLSGMVKDPPVSVEDALRYQCAVLSGDDICKGI